ncbi:MAG TPA: response regulator transcription factor, partial [Thermomicrobiales bacterium]|nr:response regulator transcription factor [Thermomicrobiales bacterium]
RVRMLNTVREFAREQLRISGEEPALRMAHARWFANQVTSTPPSTWRTGTEALAAWTGRNLPDADNFSLAVAHLYEHGDHETVLRVVTWLVPFWLEIGQLQEGAKWTPKVEPFAGNAPDDLQAHYFRMAAAMAMKDDRNDVAVQYATRALDAARKVDDLRLLANCQNHLGQMYWRAGDPVSGERYQMEAIETIRRDPDPLGGALFAAQIAEWLVGTNELDRAESLLREALPAIAAERPGALPIAQGTMADVMLGRGNLDEASIWLERSLDYHLEPPHRLPSMLAGRLLSAASLAIQRGEMEAAARFVGSSMAIGHRLGLVFDKATNAEVSRLLEPIRIELGPDQTSAQVRAGKQRSTAETLASAIAICRLRLAAPPVTPIVATAEGDLTPREREVLALLAEGLSNAAIADALSISERTVTTHLSRLYAKLDVSTRSEAISLAMRTGLAFPAGRT